MKAEELRIGNYIIYEKTTHQIKGLLKETFYSYWIKNNTKNGDYLIEYNDPEVEPIVLNEEWLNKLGFYEDSFIDDCWNNGNETIIKYDNIYEMHGIELKTVHQLQNVYYALSGEELKIK